MDAITVLVTAQEDSHNVGSVPAEISQVEEKEHNYSPL